MLLSLWDVWFFVDDSCCLNENYSKYVLYQTYLIQESLQSLYKVSFYIQSLILYSDIYIHAHSAFPNSRD